MSQSPKHKLNTNWCLWYHSLTDKEWTQKSYRNLFTVTNLYELKALNDIIELNHLQNGMFFLMREDIFPTWEDPDNREGCCVSFKISGSILREQWNSIVNRIVTEDILIDKERTDFINGISIAPKKEFNIVKLWLREHNQNYTDILKEYEPHFTKDKALIKKHELSS